MHNSGLIGSYITDLKLLLDALTPAVIDPLVKILFTAWQEGRTVVMMGNGGSSSSVSHIANDLQKNIQLETGRPLKALCITDNTPVLMAWANDTEWENVFAPQIACWVEPGDVVLGVSGSGNSKNILNGIAEANAKGAITIGLAGYGGGKLKEIAQHSLVVESFNMQRVEDVHMVALHLIFCTLLERAKASVGQPA